jgi:hypothetical protein
MSGSDGTERVVGVKLSRSSLPWLMIHRDRRRIISLAKVGMISFLPVSRIAAWPQISIPWAFRDDSVS